MGTPIQPSLFEILREIGISPEKAHAFDKAFELKNQEVHTVIDQRLKDFATKQDLENGLSALRAGMKTDIAEMRNDILKSMNDQTWKLVTYVVIINASMMGVLRLAKFF